MSKFLFKANYTQAGLEGLIGKGAASRVTAINELTASVGGTIESIHYALGDTDLYVISDLPDDEAAAGLALKVSAAGGATVETVKLLTPEQIDEAIGRQVTYRPPGS
ncbi:MAG: GYD domain-containing protein [Thermoleophilia bacterium]|nr:GYD domain-containing protein [Thermoleophilia bacterium]